METSVDQLLGFDAAEDAAVRDIAEEPESPNMAPRTPEGSKRGSREHHALPHKHGGANRRYLHQTPAGIDLS